MRGMESRLSWVHEGKNWPHRVASRFVDAAAMRWHVQCMGRGPNLLLLHGTGAATHSWRGLAPRLATHFSVVAPDLPGHGFSEPLPGRLSMQSMARALAELVNALDAAPDLVVGHSAGAAIACRMCLDQLIAPHGVVSINGALLPFEGFANWAFAPAARLLASTPLVAHLVARRARDPEAIARLVRATGSSLDSTGLDLYGRIVRDPGHVAGALSMMAGWDLVGLARELPRLALPVQLLVAAGDRTVPPRQGPQLAEVLPHARLVVLERLGHLAHEEQPAAVAALILEFARELRLLQPQRA